MPTRSGIVRAAKYFCTGALLQDQPASSSTSLTPRNLASSHFGAFLSFRKHRAIFFCANFRPLLLRRRILAPLHKHAQHAATGLTEERNKKCFTTRRLEHGVPCYRSHILGLIVDHEPPGLSVLYLRKLPGKNFTLDNLYIL